LTEAGERLIRYYDETDQPQKAREWREKMKPPLTETDSNAVK
jgi:hypothetical protein